MKIHSNFTKLALLAALSLTGATAVLAEDISSDLRWLRQVQESKNEPTAKQLAPYGYAATGAATREVSVNRGTKYLNVTRLETVKINVGGKSIVWSFDTLGTTAFPLSKIVSGAEEVTVYVAQNPHYRAGS